MLWILFGSSYKKVLIKIPIMSYFHFVFLNLIKTTQNA